MAEGRRERMRDKIRSRGAHGLPPHEVVEFLLYPFIARKDTSPLAKTLLNTFGSIDHLLNATEEELLRVPGMPKLAAITFPIYKDLVSITNEEQAKSQIKDLSTPKNAGEFCAKLLSHCTNERVMAIYVNSLGKILGHKIISDGDTTSSRFDSKLICRGAILNDADGVIIAHNHPSGNLCPSQDDIDCTSEIEIVLGNMDVKLLDHVIVSKSEYLSLRQSGYLKS